MLIHELNADPAGFVDTDLFAGAAHPLGQSWRARPQLNFRPGQVQFGWRTDALWLFAEFAGKGNTTAERDGQDLWVLGDVLELFVALAEAPDYREMHVAPTGLTLQLHFPNSEAIKEMRAAKAAPRNYAAEYGWRAWTRNFDDRWQILAKLPLPLTTGAELDIACGRYDYGSGKAVISSTAPLTKADFHRRPEWHRASLAP